ncbi:hypothetical protein JoomaDRAFT_1249 [Galbibacter orientalis DSM 19592]|uniref:Uncharacterized protein n=1 Tax=Galbibacter orientalis DSM 19592 TaxID=926559 RepID=I3C3S2_9FLAO|nr:hypothetical protein [Galbibacter orientalis]EIJ38265.1 hypothetical protein JoomaDRAFT_1249 [Galbibacter orientalis DSM 19592]
MWIAVITTLIFIIINFVHYIVLNGYAKKVGGKKMWKTWGGRLYFWQSSIITSTAGTLFVIFILKWANVLNF